MKSINNKIITRRVLFDSPIDTPSSLWNQIFDSTNFFVWGKTRGEINTLIYRTVSYRFDIDDQLKEQSEK